MFWSRPYVAVLVGRGAGLGVVPPPLPPWAGGVSRRTSHGCPARAARATLPFWWVNKLIVSPRNVKLVHRKVHVHAYTA